MRSGHTSLVVKDGHLKSQQESVKSPEIPMELKLILTGSRVKDDAIKVIIIISTES